MIQTPGCPNCQNPQATKVSFTWWGGLIGPMILSHVQCTSCGTQYNGKSGKSNQNAIVMYFVVVLGLSFGIFGCCGLASVFGNM